MKKLLNILLISILFVSCGRYIDLSPQEKFKVVYEAEVLQKKDARKTLNKINKKIAKYIKKADEKAFEDGQTYLDLIDYMQRAKKNYSSEDGVKYPSVEEVMGTDGFISGNFRLNEKLFGYCDAIDGEVFTGKAIFRNRHGQIEKVLSLKNGDVVSKIQENIYDDNNNLVQEKFYSEDTRKMICSKRYDKNGKLKKETYILKRFKNGRIKEDYVRENGSEVGRVRKYSSSGRIIKTQVK